MAAQDIKRGDLILTANAEDPSRIYADAAYADAYVDDQEWVLHAYVVTEDNHFRFEYDQLVTVLRKG